MLRLASVFAFGLTLFAQIWTADAWAQQSTIERAKRSGVITVCADPDRLPYSSQKLDPPGFDVEIAQEIAKDIGAKLGYNWFATRSGPRALRQLVGEGGCDFFLGLPVEASFEESNFKLVLSKPYYVGGFATVARSDAPDTVLQDSKSKGVGVQMGTLPDFKLFDRGYERKLFKNTTEMVEELSVKTIDAAVTPAPEGAWAIKSKGDTKLKILANTEKDFVFPMAVAVRKADKDLLELINTTIDRLESSGRMTEIFSKYGMVKLVGTGGGETPKSKAEVKKEEAAAKGGGDGTTGDKKPDTTGAAPEKKADPAPAAAAPEKKAEAAPAAAEKPAEKKAEAAPAAAAPAGETPKAAAAPGTDPGADMHGIALSREYMVDPTQVDDFPSDEKSVDDGRKLYKQACYKCHGPNGVSGGNTPDLRIFASKNTHYDMFGVIQAGRLDRGMPAWNDYLTADEIKKIVVYVKALHKK